MFPLSAWRYFMTATLDERAPTKKTTCTDACSPPRLPPPWVGGERMTREMWARAAFYFISSAVFCMWARFSCCPACFPSHGEGLVCFCGQAAVLRAGGRVNGREGLGSNGWIGKSGDGVDVQKSDQKHVFVCRLKVRKTESELHNVWSLHRCETVVFTQLIKTQIKMLVVGSDGSSDLVQDVCEHLSPVPLLKPPASVLVRERSGHHGDETDCIICSVAVWHEGLLDGGTDRRAGSRIKHVLLWRQRQSLPSTMPFDMSCERVCGSVCMSIFCLMCLWQHIF